MHQDPDQQSEYRTNFAIDKNITRYKYRIFLPKGANSKKNLQISKAEPKKDQFFNTRYPPPPPLGNHNFSTSLHMTQFLDF